MSIFAFKSGVYGNGQWGGKGEKLASFSPASGEKIAEISMGTEEELENLLQSAEKAFKVWRKVPAPHRGELVRRCGEVLRQNKENLGKLVSEEMGKSLQEGLGEVQEAIDMAEFCVGLSRQLYGLTSHSERAEHRLYEQWHPLGTIGVITAFNFPVAVWAWNAFIAAVAGDVVIWKPSSETPLCAVAVHELIQPVLEEMGHPDVFQLIVGPGRSVGQKMLEDKRFPLISFTGSTPSGRRVAEAVGKRLGRHLLELGGNNALIVSEKCRQELAIRAVLFGAVGTAGQRCTSTRRVMVQESVADKFIETLVAGYTQITIGDPLDESKLMGPLINASAVESYEKAIEAASAQGGKILCGGKKIEGAGHFVQPTLIEIDLRADIVQEETFAPILYIGRYKDLDEALEIHNAVPQGLSSALFSDDFMEVETFLSHAGSDCGIANINTGTSGAEIGMAFGGEKETGGGREAGSDSWKAYMRRQTNTINYGRELPLAQGIDFDL
jgi:aldehyde dehydrogenase (NAD+)